MTSHNRNSSLLEELSISSPRETSTEFICEQLSLGTAVSCGHAACGVAAVSATAALPPVAG